MCALHKSEVVVEEKESHMKGSQVKGQAMKKVKKRQTVDTTSQGEKKLPSKLKKTKGTAAEPKENAVYIVECNDQTLYTGWTNDIKKRLLAHNSGKGAKYTRNRYPVSLVYYQVCATKEEAMSREYAIKKLTRAQKLRLIDADHGLYRHFGDEQIHQDKMTNAATHDK